MRYRLEMKKANALKRMRVSGVGVVAGIVGGSIGLYALLNDGLGISIFFGLLCIPLMLVNAVLFVIASSDHRYARDGLRSMGDDGRIRYNVIED